MVLYCYIKLFNLFISQCFHKCLYNNDDYFLPAPSIIEEPDYHSLTGKVINTAIGDMYVVITMHIACMIDHLTNCSISLFCIVQVKMESLLGKAPDHNHVVKLLEDYSVEYDKIGLALGLSYSKRDQIRKDPTIPSPWIKLDTVINTWITEETSDVTWQLFIDAMKDKELLQLAGNIERFLETEEVKRFYAHKPLWVRTKKGIAAITCPTSFCMHCDNCDLEL